MNGSMFLKGDTMHKNSNSHEASENEQMKKPFEEPKLTYVKPKLNKQGKVAQVTQSFFGSFSP